jgi:hypothetical protein
MVKNYVAFRRRYGYPYKVLSAKYYPNGVEIFQQSSALTL